MSAETRRFDRSFFRTVSALRVRPVIPIAGAALLLLLPWLGTDAFWIRQAELILILGLVVSGLNLSFGYGGELALGQAAVYAGGAYTAGILTANGVHEMALAMLAAIALAVTVGLVSGLPGLRLGGWALAMVSFFLVLILPSILDQFRSLTGGYAGLVGVVRPRLFGFSLDEPNAYYLAVACLAVVWFAFMRNLIRSRYGVALRVLRESPVLARSLGISVYRLKVTAYVLGSIPAGVAGALFVYLDGYIAPSSFDFTAAITILAASILGGKDSFYGALLGAAIIQLGPGNAAGFQKYSLVAYGAFLVVGGLFLSGGLSEPLPVAVVGGRDTPKIRR